MEAYLLEMLIEVALKQTHSLLQAGYDYAAIKRDRCNEVLFVGDCQQVFLVILDQIWQTVLIDVVWRAYEDHIGDLEAVCMELLADLMLLHVVDDVIEQDLSVDTAHSQVFLVLTQLHARNQLWYLGKHLLLQRKHR